MPRSEQRPEFLRELSSRVSDDRRRLEGEAIWEVIEEEVANELDRRFSATVALESQNTIKATIAVEENNYDAQTISYRLGLVVNGRQFEYAATVSKEKAIMEGRHVVTDALTAGLSEYIAGTLLSGLRPQGTK